MATEKANLDSAVDAVDAVCVGVPPEAAPGATPANQKRFYKALLAADVPFVWFLSLGSPMSRTVSPPGGFGGLWDEHWQPKPVVELLASALEAPPRPSRLGARHRSRSVAFPLSGDNEHVRSLDRTRRWRH